jgi:16S rRNA (uracil1498-N3)-methyltransferase
MNVDLRSTLAHLYVPDLASGVVSEQDHHHVFTVLRARDSELVSLTDGRGSYRMAKVKGRNVVAEGEVMVAAPPRNCEIFVAIPKADRPEWIVQKLTEIGATRICWLHAERSVVHWNADRVARQMERLNKVALAASLQSRRVWFPVVEGPVTAASALPGIAICEPGGRSLNPDDERIAIGPEGGWAPRELALSDDVVSLGPSILRVETAAVVAAALMTDLHRRGQGDQ